MDGVFSQYTLNMLSQERAREQKPGNLISSSAGSDAMDVQVEASANPFPHAALSSSLAPSCPVTVSREQSAWEVKEVGERDKRKKEEEETGERRERTENEDDEEEEEQMKDEEGDEENEITESLKEIRQQAKLGAAEEDQERGKEGSANEKIDESCEWVVEREMGGGRKRPCGMGIYAFIDSLL